LAWQSAGGDRVRRPAYLRADMRGIDAAHLATTTEFNDAPPPVDTAKGEVLSSLLKSMLKKASMPVAN